MPDITPITPAAHPIRKRLWKIAGAGLAVLAVFLFFVVKWQMEDPTPGLSQGHDLLPSYVAGKLVREGHARQMYDTDVVFAAERQIGQEARLSFGKRDGPWLNPPFFAWCFVPLAAFPYRQAAAIFLAINLLLAAVSLTLLTRLLRQRLPGDERLAADALGWKTLALAPVLTLIPLPFWQAMMHQQNTFISFTLVTLAVTLWRSERLFCAGLVCGLLFFKPQLGAILAAVLLATGGRRALTGLSLTGSALLLIDVVTLPGSLGDFFHKLPPTLHHLQNELPYNWGRQVTFQSFWRLLIQGHVRGETIGLVRLLWGISSGAVAIALIAAAARFLRGSREPASRDRLIAAAIASMPLLMPYYMDYDLLLMAAPPVLLAAEWIRRETPLSRADQLLVVVWLIFGFETHANPGVAGHFRLNPAVLLLAALSALHLARCFAPAGARQAAAPREETPVAQAA